MIATKEHPIIFSAESVKAILDGRKTQTRRVVTPKTSVVGEGSVDWSSFDWESKSSYDFGDAIYTGGEKKGERMGIMKAPPVFVDDSFGLHYLHVPFRWSEDATIYRIYPRYEVGDRLWVRETFTLAWDNSVIYRADGEAKITGTEQVVKLHWKPSIHLLRKDSRITLEITEVRVERVQEITYLDAKAEGILRFDRDHPDSDGGVGYNRGVAGLPMRYESTAAFMDLWDSLNAKRGYGWEVNPWVWVISFKVV